MDIRTVNLDSAITSQVPSRRSLSAEDILFYVSREITEILGHEPGEPIGVFKVASVLRSAEGIERTDGDSWPPPPNGGTWSRAEPVGETLSHMIRDFLAVQNTPVPTGVITAHLVTKCRDRGRSDLKVTAHNVGRALHSMPDVVLVGRGIAVIGGTANVWALERVAEEWFHTISEAERAREANRRRVTFFETNKVAGVHVDGDAQVTFTKGTIDSDVLGDLLNEAHERLVQLLDQEQSLV